MNKETMSTSVEGSTAGSTMLTILQRTTPGPTVASQFPLWSIALITLSLLLASSVCIEFATVSEQHHSYSTRLWQGIYCM